MIRKETVRSIISPHWRIRTETIQGITEYCDNGLHYVSNIKNPEGNVLRESLLAKGTIPETAVPEIRSTYDANDHLLETIYPDGGIWKEKHDAEGYRDPILWSKSGSDSMG